MWNSHPICYEVRFKILAKIMKWLKAIFPKGGTYCNECYSSPASRRIHFWSTNGAPCRVSQPSAGDQAGSPHNCPLQYDQLEIHIYLLDIVYIWSTDWCTQYTDSIAMGQTMEIRLTLFLCWGPARDSNLNQSLILPIACVYSSHAPLGGL